MKIYIKPVYCLWVVELWWMTCPSCHLIFILAYLGMILHVRHVLLKYMFALHNSSLLLIFLYLFMLYARLAFTNLIVGLCILHTQDYSNLHNHCLRKSIYHKWIVVSALCYKPEGHGFHTRCHRIFSIYLILPAALGPGVYWASNRNEYQNQKNVSVE
jgi:hypothetical protein